MGFIHIVLGIYGGSNTAVDPIAICVAATDSYVAGPQAISSYIAGPVAYDQHVAGTEAQDNC